MNKVDLTLVKNVLERFYGKYPLYTIAAALGVTQQAVYYHAKKLGLHKKNRMTTKVYDKNMREILIKKVKYEIKKLEQKEKQD